MQPWQTGFRVNAEVGFLLLSTDNKNGGFTRRSMLAGAGVLAAATFLPAASATADSDNPFMPEPPTAERPYHYIKYDETTKAANPERSPIELVIGIPRGGEAGQVYAGKIVVVHFGTNEDSLSDYQKSVLIQSMEALAQHSEREFLFVDVVALDRDYNPVYLSDMIASINVENKLGANGEQIELSPKDDRIVPYGLVSAPKDRANNADNMDMVFDFTIGNFNGEDLGRNAIPARANFIYQGLRHTVMEQNNLIESLR
jgi:hypothetical protein